MKIKKHFSYSSKKQIWRLLPTDSDKIIIEERDIKTKQVYFNCIDLKSGKSVIKNLQLSEKTWIGIELIYDDIIFFHKFVKPDMPQHSGIIAYSITQNKILWQTDDHNFLFLYDNALYTFQQTFEGRDHYQLNYKTGKVLNEKILTDNDIKKIQANLIKSDDQSNYLFPEVFEDSKIEIAKVKEAIEKLKEEQIITGKIKYLIVNNLLMLNFHTVLENNYLRNMFKTVDLNSGKIILEEIPDMKTKLFIPDSFFIKSKYLFLLIGRNKFKTFTIE